jgi:hypothetical protein
VEVPAGRYTVEVFTGRDRFGGAQVDVPAHGRAGVLIEGD